MAAEHGVLEAVERYYGAKIAEHGPTARGVDWNDEASQELRFEQLLKVYFEGDLDAGFVFGGQVAGRIRSIEPVATIVDRTVTEFQEVMIEMAGRWAGRSS